VNSSPTCSSDEVGCSVTLALRFDSFCQKERSRAIVALLTTRPLLPWAASSRSSTCSFAAPASNESTPQLRHGTLLQRNCRGLGKLRGCMHD